MSQSKERFSDGNIKRLQQEIALIEPLLELDGSWTVNDADIKDIHKTGVIQLLEHHNAIYRVGERNTRQKWAWNEKLRAKLLSFRDSLNRFCDYTDEGCSHRVHIYHHPEKDCYTCKLCDNNPEYDRETIEAGLA